MLDDEKKNKLISHYRHEYDILQSSYFLMGMLLNENQIRRRIDELSLGECYIYGGGFLGIQCFRALDKYVSIKAVVDSRGSLKFDCHDIKVINVEELRNIYNDEVIIITPIQFSKEIYTELRKFAEDDKLLFLGELVQGGV